MSTPRSSVITSPSDRRSTPSTGRGTGTGSCGSGAPHRRQVAPLGGFTCPLGQISAGTTGPMRSGGAVIATYSGRAPRLTVDPDSPGPGPRGGAGGWTAFRRRPAPAVRTARRRAGRADRHCPVRHLPAGPGRLAGLAGWLAGRRGHRRRGPAAQPTAAVSDSGRRRGLLGHHGGQACRRGWCCGSPGAGMGPERQCDRSRKSSGRARYACSSGDAARRYQSFPTGLTGRAPGCGPDQPMPRQAERRRRRGRSARPGTGGSRSARAARGRRCPLVVGGREPGHGRHGRLRARGQRPWSSGSSLGGRRGNVGTGGARRDGHRAGGRDRRGRGQWAGDGRR